MASKIALSLMVAALFAIVVAEHGWGHGGGGGGGQGGGHGHDHGWGHAKYKYAYGVKDSHTHDQKEAAEYRDGDTVKGHYSLLEPDGHWRTVNYWADKTGFHAKVSRTHGWSGGSP